MNCRLCGKFTKPGPSSTIVGEFAVHNNCQPGRKKNPKPNKKVRNFQEKKKSKKNPFIAPLSTRGWRDVV